MCVQTSGSALTYLEQRQEWVLGQITHLQDKVKALAQEFGIGPEEVGILHQQVCVCTYGMEHLCAVLT